MLIGSPFPTYSDVDGSPLEAGYLYFGTVNLNPETNPITVYWDAALTQPAAQPIRTSGGYIVRDGARANLYIGGEYSLTVKNKNSVLLFSMPDSSDFDNSVSSSLFASDLLNTSDNLKGDALIGVKRILTNAVATTLHNWMEAQTINVKSDYSAKGDGVTDDTASIQNAINYLNSIGGGALFIPQGVYLVTGLTVYSNISIFGAGRISTTIKLKSNSNADLIYGNGSNALWGGGTGGGISGFGLFNITLDGNRAENATSGSCIAIYGEELYFENLWVRNSRDWGIRTEWADADSSFGMESHYINVRIDSCGKDGWYNNGPHDSVSINLIVIDASLNADKTFNGILIGPRMTGRFIGCHVWNRAASFRHYMALNIQQGGGGNEFVACHFEGAWGANVGIFCSKNTFDDSCRYYSAWNGVNIYMGGTAATFNSIRGQLDAPGSGRPASVGIVMGSIASDYIADNVIEVTAVAQEGGLINFTTYDGGNNRITANCYNTTSTTINGVPHTTDVLDIVFNGYSSGARINNKVQRGKINIGANTSATWTFPYAFSLTPIVTFSPEAPSGTISSGIWISSVSTTSVTIFNNNAVSMALNIHAHSF